MYFVWINFNFVYKIQLAVIWLWKWENFRKKSLWKWENFRKKSQISFLKFGVSLKNKIFGNLQTLNGLFTFQVVWALCFHILNNFFYFQGFFNSWHFLRGSKGGAKRVNTIYIAKIALKKRKMCIKSALKCSKMLKNG